MYCRKTADESVNIACHIWTLFETTTDSHKDFGHIVGCWQKNTIVRSIAGRLLLMQWKESKDRSQATAADQTSDLLRRAELFRFDDDRYLVGGPPPLASFNMRGGGYNN